MRAPELANLPDPFILEELSYVQIRDACKADFVVKAAAHGLTYDVDMLETDPDVILLEVEAYREVLLRARINDAARANLLAFAEKADLDHLGAGASPPVIRMEGEEDDRYANRIRLSGMARNVGSRERYQLTALSADIQVKDVIAYRLGRDPRVYVALLSTAADGVATPTTIANVEAALALERNHLVNGTTIVRSAVTSVTDITARLVRLPNTPATVLDTITIAMRAAWLQEGGLGRDLTRDWIRARLMMPGIYSAEIDVPAQSRVVPPYEATAIGAINLSFIGENQ